MNNKKNMKRDIILTIIVSAFLFTTIGIFSIGTDINYKLIITFLGSTIFAIIVCVIRHMFFKTKNLTVGEIVNIKKASYNKATKILTCEYTNGLSLEFKSVLSGWRLMPINTSCSQDVNKKLNEIYSFIKKNNKDYVNM